jgi:hypothetical protein
MELAYFLDALGYSDSPHFLRRGTAALRTAPDFGHVFRNASRKPCNLEGVYTLRRTPDSRTEPLVPVVYVCRADSENAASKIHELVWNQDVVPFLLVHSPQGVRLYSGFRCQPQKKGVERGVLKVLTQFNQVSELIDSFHADAIDNGKLWRDKGGEVTPETRVDWKLLANLQKLDHWLRRQGGLEKDVSHALIGKYVYLHYLRDREILSDARLAEWQLDKSTIFGRNATRAGLQAVNDRLDDWLNGSVFPLKLRGKGAPDDRVVGIVAAIFDGDEIAGQSDLQLHLDFQIYDFSYIPIETLSVIYEQFLHMPEQDGKKTKGEEAAAYYTPIPVVNFMLSEMDERLPLRRGMKVFDPACGSGAFLVQSYRRLIEREFPDTKSKPTPQQLKDLLEGHIFGIDNDPDACQVTELSLILTLLDYVDPPDLLPKSATKQESDFKLPSLGDTNVFHTNFFKLKTKAKQVLTNTKFDWIVGNPPWKDLDPAKLNEQDEPVWKWMSDPVNKNAQPCGDNEVAQAFAWRVCDFLDDTGAAALLLPAMTLFEDLSRKFRARFFVSHRVTAVANFSNLAEVLFASGQAAVKRPRIPAAAFFYRPRNSNESDLADECIKVFSPFVANQEVTRPESTGQRNPTWTLLITANEIREVLFTDVNCGAALPWKLAAWGSPADIGLLRRLEKKMLLLRELEDQGFLVVAEGPALVLTESKIGPKRTRLVPEVVGKRTIDMRKLKRMRHLFSLPEYALKPNEKHFLELRGNQVGLLVCSPPHVIVSAARTFAIYNDDYLVVPKTQIGIWSKNENADFLKALSLYLSSDFVLYHQFLAAPQFGVKRDVATLNALRSVPVPIVNLNEEQLKPWLALHNRLLKTTAIDVRETRNEAPNKGRSLFESDEETLVSLLVELNDLVYQSLGLESHDQSLVHDLVHVRLHLIDGNVRPPAVRPPKPDELRIYARRLKAELDGFFEGELDKWHQIGIVFDKASVSGMVQIDLIADKAAARDVVVVPADGPTAKELEKTRRRLRKRHSQWVYFDRNLRIYERSKTFIFKPLQRFQWTESQAMLDASEIIAEILQLGDDSA